MVGAGLRVDVDAVLPQRVGGRLGQVQLGLGAAAVAVYCSRFYFNKTFIDFLKLQAKYLE